MSEETMPGIWDGCYQPVTVSLYNSGGVEPSESLRYDCGECEWCKLWGDSEFFSPAWHLERRKEALADEIIHSDR